MDATLNEWLQLLLRWFHIFTGILWVGQTYFFTWLDNSLRRVQGRDEKVVGETWMVHSGGFYFVEKQKFVPGEMPPVLHWFRWEAFFTWLSGFFLLGMIYYMGGALLLPDAHISLGAGVAIGLGSLVGAWVVYDLLSMSPLGKLPIVMSVIGYGLIVGSAYGLSHVMSGRAAFIHVGAMMGTIMVMNVWMRILPGQRKMLEDVKANRPVRHELGERGRIRSKQNTYMATSVVLLMVSNHFPTLYGSDYNWAWLAGLVLVGWAGRWLLIRPAHA